MEGAGRREGGEREGEVNRDAISPHHDPSEVSNEPLG